MISKPCNIEYPKIRFYSLLGATAATAVLNHKGPLSKVRGKLKNIKIMNSYFNVLTTFHPAFLLRQPNKKKFFQKDLLILKKIIIKKKYHE